MVAARVQRPELRRIKLQRDRADIDRRLAKNNLLPNLDVGASVSQDFGVERYKDKGELELEAGIEFKVPLQRREARGRLEAVEAQIERLGAEEAFARDRIAADIRDAFSAWEAAFEQARQTRLNVDLAVDLQEAEKTLFERGAADLLALQIPEAVLGMHSHWLPLRLAIHERAVAQTLQAKVGRNEPCPCGSGKKFKKCCGAPADLH